MRAIQNAEFNWNRFQHPEFTRATDPVVERKAVERLPFRVRVVQDDDDLARAVDVRYSAYSRHVPEIAAGLRGPEALDRADGVAVLIAESRLDGSTLGTMRIQTNRYAPLTLEQSIELPDWLDGASTAEATRLGVTAKAGPLVRTMLFKAYYRYCLAAGIDWMVIAARRPMDRIYDALMFEDVIPGAGYMPMRHAANIPHRVMALSVRGVEAKWRAAGHAQSAFMFDTEHPDLEIEVPTEVRPALRAPTPVVLPQPAQMM
jgi:hypothetical protein